MHFIKLKQLVKLSAAMLPAILLASCAPTSSSGGNDLTFCSGAKPIYWSAKDTSGTVVQIKELNNVGRKICGWGSK